MGVRLYFITVYRKNQHSIGFVLGKHGIDRIFHVFVGVLLLAEPVGGGSGFLVFVDRKLHRVTHLILGEQAEQVVCRGDSRTVHRIDQIPR